MSYNPGNPTRTTKLAAGIYSIDSFSSETQSYRVDLNARTCTCKHFTKRLVGTNADCKHLTACRAARFQQIEATAKSLPTERLEELQSKYFGQDGKVWLAITNELHERHTAQMKEGLRADRQKAEAAARDQELRAIFA